MNAAQDGLMPDGREGAIVPRKGKAIWQPMIQGIYKRVKSSGSVAALAANVVYDGETFEVLLGDEDRIIHRRDMALVQRGKEVAVYAIASLKDGTKEREVMTWDQVEAVRQSSSMPNSGPWTQWTDEMARKTVVRRLAKRLPVIEGADEALHRTINRVDSLYEFGTAPPEHPIIDADQPPLKTAASDMKRPPKVTATDDPPPTPPKRTAREWLDAFEIAMRDCHTNGEVNRLITKPDTQKAKALFDNIPEAKKRFDKIVADGMAAHAPIRHPSENVTYPDDGDAASEDDLAEVQIAGAEKLAAGD
jgi:recombination protein RecT